MVPSSKEQLAKYIDHTLLTATACRADIERLCADILAPTNVKVAGVAGFPFGADTARIKAFDAKEIIMAGADEVDMVADLAAIIEADREYLTGDLAGVLKVCKSFRPEVTLKVIIESAALSDEQIVFVCETAQAVGVDFIKTSTGLNPAGGATVEDIKLMAQTAPRCKIKAAGGIRTTEQALAMIEAGASRIGTSASVAIVEGFK